MPGKPRVVYLDVDDEITSAAARIRSADASRVALVVPAGSRVATSRINFRLLAREALSAGRQLAIVAPDAASRSLAAAAGLDVFRTVGEYEAADEAGRGDGAPRGSGEVAGAVAGAGAAGVGGARTRSADLARDGSVSRDGGRDSRADDRATGAWAAEGAGGAAAAGDGVGMADEIRPRSNIAGVRAGIDVSGSGSNRRTLMVGLALLVLGLVVVAGVAGYLFLPQATIVVVPRVEPIGPVQVNIVADPTATAPDVEAGVVPAQRISFPVQANGTFKATGQKVDETKATGTVTFTSQNTLFDVTVPAGTDISTASGIHFLVTKDITVPKASFATGPTSVDTSVQAVKPGPSGNVAANTVTSEPMTLTAALISVTNQQPTSGGTRTVTPKVAQADVDAAKAALKQELQDGFAQELQAGSGVPAGLTLFAQTGKLGDPTFNADPASLVGQEVAQFSLGASATGTATAVDEQPVSSVAETRLRAQVRSGYDLVAGSVHVEVGQPTVDGERIAFPATGTASEVPRLDASALEAQVRGRSVDEARSILSRYGTVTITTWPDWVSSIPTNDFRVDLSIRPTPIESGAPPSGGSTVPASPGASSPASPAASSPSPS